jgi:Fe2+ transport system protein FeoA
MLLSEIKKGQKAIVLRLDNPKKIKKRLENVGVTPGTKIVFIRKAPLGDPIEIKVRDFYLAIRLSDADKIWVKQI